MLQLAPSKLPVTTPFMSHEPRADRMLARARGDMNDVVIARMLTSWNRGEGVLPRWMGLSPDRFREMIGFHFPGTTPPLGRNMQSKPDLERIDEREDLVRLLNSHRAQKSRSEVWVLEILVAACMGGGHLWHDMGLWARSDLSALMARNFPALAARNTKNMKWKKFLYKQLCESYGIYICRAPSCEVCSDYQVCFGPED